MCLLCEHHVVESKAQAYLIQKESGLKKSDLILIAEHYIQCSRHFEAIKAVEQARVANSFAKRCGDFARRLPWRSLFSHQKASSPSLPAP